MAYDPTLFQGTATYYTSGRPPYSRDLVPTLAAEGRLDGSGRLLDVGCGPGILSLALANHFEEVIGLDPDREMLAEGARRAAQSGLENIQWAQGRAEEISTLDLGMFRMVTFGQSFHWTDRERVAEMVYDRLESGGVLAIISHAHEGRPQPEGPGYPPIPHEAIRALIERYLGPRRRAGQGGFAQPTDPHEDLLARTRFGVSRRVFCAGRDDIVQDIDAVLANYFSMSFAAPPLFGDQRARFEEDVRAALTAYSPSGLFWDWPGDTQIVLAGKTGQGKRS
ncbi:MAG: class I SAM-dependent methyltransferase [Armatimonadetes bacterium]|nr:class I SAM-dependent methyltransferase [Armatimonadota bacterium]